MGSPSLERSQDVWVWHLGTRLSGEPPGGAGFRVGLDDLKSFSNQMIPWS